MRKAIIIAALVLFIPALAFAAVGLKSAGTYLGAASDINFSSGTSVSFDGTTATITGTNTGSTAAITSGTIAGVTINSSSVGVTTPAVGKFTTLTAVQQGSTVAVLTPGATPAVDAATANVFTLTPGEAENISITGGIAGQAITLVVTTSGTNTYTLTFGSGFKSTGTLATGASSGKVFVVRFVTADGTTFNEVSRTTAM